MGAFPTTNITVKFYGNALMRTLGLWMVNELETESGTYMIPHSVASQIKAAHQFYFNVYRELNFIASF